MRGVRVYPHADRHVASWAVTLAIVFAVAAVVFLPGCSVTSSYVDADQATFDAVAPEYRAYVDADASKDAAEKARRVRTITAWKARLKRAKESNK